MVGWEEVSIEYSIATHRLKVPDGWLVRVKSTTQKKEGPEIVMTVTFVSDPDHVWKI